jgi:hypothetical protein
MFRELTQQTRDLITDDTNTYNTNTYNTDIYDTYKTYNT